MARFFAEVGVPCQHPYVDSGAVAVDQVQVVAGIILIEAALAGNGGGNAHTEHAVKNSSIRGFHQFAIGAYRVLMHMDIDKAGGCLLYTSRCV